MSTDVSKCAQVVFELMCKAAELIIQSKVQLGGKRSSSNPNSKVCVSVRLCLCIGCARLRVLSVAPTHVRTYELICVGSRYFLEEIRTSRAQATREGDTTQESRFLLLLLLPLCSTGTLTMASAFVRSLSPVSPARVGSSRCTSKRLTSLETP